MTDQLAIDGSIAAIANKVATAGGATAVIGGLTANEIAAFGGLIVAAIGVVIQLYYKRKADKRDTEFHAARMAELKE